MSIGIAVFYWKDPDHTTDVFMNPCDIAPWRPYQPNGPWLAMYEWCDSSPKSAQQLLALCNHMELEIPEGHTMVCSDDFGSNQDICVIVHEGVNRCVVNLHVTRTSERNMTCGVEHHRQNYTFTAPTWVQGTFLSKYGMFESLVFSKAVTCSAWLHLHPIVVKN